MSTNIAAVLQAVLDAEATAAAAKATSERLRAVLVTEANREVTERGVFPTWKAAGTGVARFDAAGEWVATGFDLADVGSYLAQRHPAGVAATIELMDAAKLPEALEALAFAGITVQRSDALPRPTFLADWSKGLIVDVVEVEAKGEPVKRAFTVMEVDEQGVSEVVPGMTGYRSPAKLVITLDKAAKRKAIANGLDAVAALIPAEEEVPQAPAVTPEPAPVTAEAPAVPPAAPADAPQVLTDAADPKGDDGDVFDADLDAMKVDPLKRLARSMGLPAGGTKAVLRDRILAARRAEAADAGVAADHAAP